MSLLIFINLFGFFKIKRNFFTWPSISVITFGTKNWGNSPSKELVSGYPNHTLLAILF